MKENILQNFCFQELQDGTGMDYACSSWKLLPVKGRPFSIFVNEFVSHFALLQLYSHHLVSHFRNIEVESNDGSHLESLDVLGPGRRIFKQETMMALGRSPEYHWDQIISKSVHRFSRRSRLKLFSIYSPGDHFIQQSGTV